MFEFEMKGDMEAMIELEKELLDHLGFKKFYDKEYPKDDYVNVANKYEVKELEHEHEARLRNENGPVFFLKNFPNYSSPFWNMKQDANTQLTEGSAKKVDVILNGVETIGSAQRSTDPQEMRKQFHTISEGRYADILFSNFTKERVEKELDNFLSFKFFERSGGGIGLTRMIKALQDCGL